MPLSFFMIGWVVFDRKLNFAYFGNLDNLKLSIPYFRPGINKKYCSGNLKSIASVFGATEGSTNCSHQPCSFLETICKIHFLTQFSTDFGQHGRSQMINNAVLYPIMKKKLWFLMQIQKFLTKSSFRSQINISLKRTKVLRAAK